MRSSREAKELVVRGSTKSCMEPIAYLCKRKNRTWLPSGPMLVVVIAVVVGTTVSY